MKNSIILTIFILLGVSLGTGLNAQTLVTLGQPDQLAAVISGSTTICNGHSVTISVAITGGTAPYYVTHDAVTTSSTTSPITFMVTPATSTTYDELNVTVTDANGCTSIISGSAEVTVNAQPVGPTLLANTPNLPDVCDGQSVSATFAAGSGGVGCTDQYEYSTDNGSNWEVYAPGASISTTGATVVLIQGKRDGCTNGAGCIGTSWTTLASWTVKNTPSIDPISSPTICHGGSLNPIAPAVTPNGSAVTAEGWQLETGVGTGVYSNITVPYPVVFADNGKKIRYYATNDCGTNSTSAVEITVHDWVVKVEPVDHLDPVLFYCDPTDAIEFAIAAASPGDVIKVKSGSYGSLNDIKGLVWEPGNSPGCVTVDDLVLGVTSTLIMEIDGATSDCPTTTSTTYDRIFVDEGWVVLGNATLTLVGSTSLLNGTVLTIINKGSTHPVDGTFAGGPSYYDGFNYWLIDYTGGDGNDVTLTAGSPPVITTCPGNITTSSVFPKCAAEVGYTFVATGFPTPSITYDFSVATTVINGAGTGSGEIFNVGLTTVSITATNDHGTVTCTFDVVVTDDEKPSVTCPTPANPYTADTDKCYAELSFSATVDDNCGVSSTVYSVLGTPIIFPYNFPVGTTTVDVLVTDIHSNTNTCSFDVVVDDDQIPTIACGGNQAKNTDAGQCTYTVQGTEFDYTSYSDNCSVILSWTLSGATTLTGLNTLDGVEFEKGTTYVEWKVTDVGNNSFTCSFTVEVTDNEAPSYGLTCPGNQTYTQSGLADCDKVFFWTEPTFTDNCGVTGVVRSTSPAFTLVQPYTPGGIAIKELSIGVYTVAYKASDAHGNSTTCSFTLTLIDAYPPVITCPQVTAPYSSDGGLCTASLSFTATATDNCGTTGPPVWPTIVYSLDAGVTNVIIFPHNFPVATTTVYATAYDRSSNTAQCSFIVVVEDNEKPVLIAPATACPSLNIPDVDECLATAASWDATSIYTSIRDLYQDNCTPTANLAVAFVGPAVPGVGNSDCNWSFTYNYTITDVAGNVSNTCAVTRSGSDDTEPVINTAAANANVECTGTDPDLNAAYLTWLGNKGGAVATDACNNVTWNNNAGSQTWIGDACSVSKTVTFTATDDCTNATSTTATFTIVDTTDPTFTAPAAITVYKDANCVYDVDPTITGEPTSVSDVCTATPAVTYLDALAVGSCADETIITRTWTVTDACGNSNSLDQIITVKDIIQPTFTTPANITIFKDAGCAYNALPAITGEPTAVDDNCTVTPTVTYTDVVTVGSCADETIITRTWKVTDACGNSTTDDQIITVKDNIAPTFTVPVATTIYKDGDCLYNASPSITGEPTAVSDNCTVTPTVTYTDATAVGSCTHETIITRTWTVTDACGNSTSLDQIITVEDNTAPTFTAPVATTIYKDASCGFDSNPTITGEPTLVDDNCDPAPAVTYLDAFAVGSCADETIITRTWTVTDACGNSTSLDQIITVKDIIQPTFTTPANITIFKDAGCAYNALPAITGEPTAVDDNCTVTPTVTYTDVVTVGSCADETIITRTWKVTDACGNSTTDDQIITVKDNIAPTFTVPVATTIYKDGDCLYNASPSITGEPTAVSDNCTVTPTVTYTDATAVGSCTHETIITRTWTVTDACGNSTSLDQIITVEDNTAPTFTAPVATTIYKDASCGFDSNPNITGEPTLVDDNCDPAPAVTYLDAFAVGSCADETIISRTWTVTDACGNSTSLDQIITVKDIIQPTFTTPANFTIFKDAGCAYNALPAITGEPTAVDDNCTVTPTVTYTDVVTVGSCADETIITRTWKVTDACGNSTTDDQIITVKDNIAPTFTVPVATTIYKDGDCLYNASPSITGEPTAVSDNCTVTPTVTYTDATAVGSCTHETIITRTWTVTDACGNSTSLNQIITVEDNTPPTFTAPVATTIYKDASCGFDSNPTITGEPTLVDDNCDPAPSVTYLDAFAVGSCADETIITRTWTVTDACGNSTSLAQIITVEDNAAPTFTVPADITIYKVMACAYDADPLITGVPTSVSDNCDVSPTITYNDIITVGSCPHETIITRTWKAEDNCGNFTTDVQVITVEDNTPPVINTSLFPAAPVVLTTGATNCAATYAWPVPAVTDNCDVAPVLTVSFSDPTVTYVWIPDVGTGYHQALFNKGVTTVTYTVVDDCGNSSQASFNVTVNDVTPPTIAGVPANITINNIPGTCHAQVWWNEPTASDNCPGVSIATTHIPGSLFNAGQTTTVTYTATDASGLITTASFTVTVIDNEAPVVITKNITINLDANGNASIVPADVNNGSYDNCGIVSMTVIPNTFTCANVGPNVVTLTAWDQQGNTTSATATVTVNDVTPPVVLTQNITVQLNAAGTVTITAAQVDAGSSDTCGIATMTLDTYTFGCTDVGPNTVTLTVTDNNNNVASATAIVTVQDVTAPNVITQNITVNLDAVNGLASITPAMINLNSSDACGIATMTLNITNFDCNDVGPNTVTLTVTDVNNNSASATAVVTVQDVTPPTAMCQNLTLYLDAYGNTSTTAAAVDNGSFDNCDIETLVLSNSSFNCGDDGPNNVTLTVKDNNGKVSTCTAEITVLDNIPPTVLTQNITLYLDATGNTSTTAAAIDAGSEDNCGIDTKVLSKTAFNCSNVGPNTVTLTVTDVNGLSSSATATVTVVDNIFPTAKCQNVTLYLDANGVTSTTAAAVNDGSFDNCGIQSVVLSKTAFDCDDWGINYVTLTVTDVNNNISTCNAEINVMDIIKPTAICQNLTLYLDATGNTSTTAAAVDALSFDNCGIQSLALSQTAFNCSHVGFNTVTLLVTDVNNNTNTCTAQIEVKDINCTDCEHQAAYSLSGCQRCNLYGSP
jgi:hypothetical protein